MWVLTMDHVTISESEYIDLLRYKEIVKSLEFMVHEPEFRKDFIERIVAAEKRIAGGEKKRFKSISEMSKSLDE